MICDVTCIIRITLVMLYLDRTPPTFIHSFIHSTTMDPNYVEPAVGWFSLSLIIAGLAQALNRSSLGWWLFGIFTGPLALFVLVVFFGKNEEGA